MALADRQAWWDLYHPCRPPNTAHTWDGRVCSACWLVLSAKGSSIERRKRAAKLAILFGDVCHYCRCTLTDDNRTVDHVVPKSRGGTNEFSNTVLACRPCNEDKADKLLSEWKRNDTDRATG